MHKRILITGISGFLGSQIAKQLILQGHELIALKRPSSVLWRCEDFLNKITWISIEDSNWLTIIIELHPQIIIHSAWSGVSATDRDDWEIQFSNIDFMLILSRLFLIRSIAFGFNDR